MNAGFDPTRLYQALQNTGLSTKDNPLYQVIRLLIDQLSKLTANSSGGSSGGGSSTIVNQTVIQTIDAAGSSSDFDNIPIPGGKGDKGNTGDRGAPGLDVLDSPGDDISFPIPGPQGEPGQSIIGPPGLDADYFDDNVPLTPPINFGFIPFYEIFNTDTGSQNDWDPGIFGHTTIFWSGSSLIEITGLTRGFPGQRVTFKNVGSNNALFYDQNGGSDAANQFVNAVTSYATAVAPTGWITYEYDGTNWKLIDHQQGGFIQITYNSGNFTASGGATWTVQSADQIDFSYKLDGAVVTIVFKITSTSVSGGPAGVLFATVPYTSAVNVTGLFFLGTDNGVQKAAVAVASATSNQLIFAQVFTGATAWANSVNNTGVEGSVSFTAT